MVVHLVSGFLGSGKTTAIRAALSLAGNGGADRGDSDRDGLDRGGARHGRERHGGAAAITNDQGTALVDTAELTSVTASTREVTAGCFCCRYDDLAAKIRELVAQHQPDTIFAESVGSCTDITATVAVPLENGMLLGTEHGTTTPSVTRSTFVDIRLLRSWLSQRSLPFSPEVSYIFEQQLSDSDLVILNKADLVATKEAGTTLGLARKAFPNTEVILQNSLEQRDVRAWVEQIGEISAVYLAGRRGSAGAVHREAVDYDRYAAGEAALVWYNSTVVFQNVQEPATAAAELFLLGLRTELSAIIRGSDKKGRGEMDHWWRNRVKLYISDGISGKKVDLDAAGDWVPSVLPALSAARDRLTITVNARVEEPSGSIVESIHRASELVVDRGLAGNFSVRNEQQFRPAYPRPFYRMA